VGDEQKGEQMSQQTSQQNKALVRRWWDDLWNRIDLDAADQILSADFVEHLTHEHVRGIEELKEYVSIYRSAFPDMQNRVEKMVAEADMVAVLWRSRGTHQGEFMGFQPTGREVTFTGMRLFRIAENKIVEGWVTIDAQGWQEQMEEEEQLGTRRLHFHRSS
jgi:steroid delta-isomerase-like uncharacterized protein